MKRGRTGEENRGAGEEPCYEGVRDAKARKAID